MNTRLEEQTQNTPIVVRIIRCLCPKHVAKLAKEFEVNRRLTSETAKTFIQSA